MSNSLWEQRGGIEFEKLFLDHPPHQIRYIRNMSTIAEPTLEPIAV